MSTTVFAEGPAPRYIDGDREVEYFDFNFDPSHSSEPGWDFSSAGAEKKFNNRNFVVSVNRFENLSYSVGYCLTRWDGRTSDIVYHYGTGNIGAGRGDIGAGDYVELNGRKSPSEFSSSPRISGQFSPDSAA